MMDPRSRSLACVFAEAEPKPQDARCVTRAYDTPWTLETYASRQAWMERASYIREHILTSTGLWPLPERTPLRVKFTSRVEVGGEYSVENVYFHSMPGFLVCGNLYRPLSRRSRTSPGVLCPHGHWPAGRLENSEASSVPGRCIGLARRGFAAFSYDMVGYIDSDQVSHRGLRGRREDLWGIGILGVQLWNSIRAVDFLAQLPDVDARRLGCTGASGGGTQSFLLSAVDERIRAAAPVNMVSAFMQGGCACENQAHLRLDINNVEIAAAMAPRPQLLVAATGDWTVNTPWHEFPAVKGIYELMNAADRVSACQIDAGHNYNRESREQVYRFLSRWLLSARAGSPGHRSERSFDVESEHALRVFGCGTPKPSGLLDEEALTQALIARQRRGWRAMDPASGGSLARWRRVMGTGLRHALAVTCPPPGTVRAREQGRIRRDGLAVQWLLLGSEYGESIPATLLSPAAAGRRSPAVLVVHPQGKEALFKGRCKRQPGELIAALLARGLRVLTLDLFLTGESLPADGDPAAYADRQSQAHFSTYNRSVASWRVQDLLTGLSYLADREDVGARSLFGLGSTGLLCLFAASCARHLRAVYAEVGGFDLNDDGAWAKHCFIPTVRSAGDLRTALALIAPGRLYVHTEARRGFPKAWAHKLYGLAGEPGNLTLATGKKPNPGRAAGALFGTRVHE